MALFSSAPKSLCILRLSAIGDVCNTVAAVQAIQKQWPETDITWITGKLEAQLIHDLKNINVIVFDKKQGWRAYSNLWKQLKGRRFDALLHMQSAIRASVATLGIKAKYKLGFDKIRSNDLQHLFTNVKVPSPSSAHVLDGLLAFVETLGVTVENIDWTIPYQDKDAEWAIEQLSSSSKNLIIVPGASKAYKNWTAKGYAEVIQHARDKGFHVVLAGSPAKVEVDLADDIEALLDDKVSNLVGKSSLKQMLALLDKGDMVIAPDTGPAHMANAVNTPVIGLYAHHNPKRVGPYNYRDYVVSVYETCLEKETGKKSAELNWRTRVKDQNAMQYITSDMIIGMFDRVCHKLNLKDKNEY